MKYENLILRVYEAVDQLKREGKPITQSAIAAELKLPSHPLNHFPVIRIILFKIVSEENALKHRQLRQEELTAQVKEAVDKLRAKITPGTPKVVNAKTTYLAVSGESKLHGKNGVFSEFLGFLCITGIPVVILVLMVAQLLNIWGANHGIRSNQNKAL